MKRCYKIPTWGLTTKTNTSKLMHQHPVQDKDDETQINNREIEGIRNDRHTSRPHALLS